MLSDEELAERGLLREIPEWVAVLREDDEEEEDEDDEDDTHIRILILRKLRKILTEKLEDTVCRDARFNAVVGAGAVDVAVGLLNDYQGADLYELRESAIQLLRVVAGHSLAYRNLVLRDGAMNPLLSLLEDANAPSSVSAAAMSTMTMICGRLAHETNASVRARIDSIPKSRILPILVQVIEGATEDEELSNALNALAAVLAPTDTIKETSEIFFNAGGLPHLVERLLHGEKWGVVDSAQAATEYLISSENEAIKQFLVEKHAIDFLLSNKPGVCYLFRDLVRGNVDTGMIQAMIDSLIGRLRTSRSKSWGEILCAIPLIQTITETRNANDIEVLVKLGAIPPLLDEFKAYPLTGTPDRYVVSTVSIISDIAKAGKPGDIRLLAYEARKTGSLFRMMGHNDLQLIVLPVLETLEILLRDDTFFFCLEDTLLLPDLVAASDGNVRKAAASLLSSVAESEASTGGATLVPCVGSLCALLSASCEDQVLCALQVLKSVVSHGGRDTENSIQEAGGIQKFEELKQSDNIDISKEASKVLFAFLYRKRNRSDPKESQNTNSNQIKS